MIATCSACRAMFETSYEDASTPGTLCPACHRAPVAVDVPPGTPLHGLARLAADAPEVRREVVRAADLPAGLALAANGKVFIYGPGSGSGRPTAVLPEAEAARRLLAFDALFQACRALLTYADKTGNCNVCAREHLDHAPDCPVETARAALRGAKP